MLTSVSSEKEKVLSQAIGIFTVLAMIISCLGLFGLSSFTAERKTKEIGIRRVLGATISNITYLLSKNFVRPIILAFIISTPISYLVIQEWLNNFAFRIDISPAYFLAGGLIALIIGLVTVSGQCVKTALKNPIISLRNE